MMRIWDLAAPFHLCNVCVAAGSTVEKTQDNPVIYGDAFRKQRGFRLPVLYKSTLFLSQTAVSSLLMRFQEWAGPWDVCTIVGQGDLVLLVPLAAGFSAQAP